MRLALVPSDGGLLPVAKAMHEREKRRKRDDQMNRHQKLRKQHGLPTNDEVRQARADEAAANQAKADAADKPAKGKGKDDSK